MVQCSPSLLTLADAARVNLADTLVERRRLGEDRFALLVGRYVHGIGDSDYTDVAVLIPRSIFFQSELYHRLNNTDGLVPGPLLDPVQVAWRDIARTKEDGVHLALNAGKVLREDWRALRRRRRPAKVPQDTKGIARFRTEP